MKNMGDLPDQFKECFTKYESSRCIDDIERPIKQYLEFKDVLNVYKSTAFLVNISSEIQQYVTKVKLELRKDVENLNLESEEFYKIINYLY